MLLMLYSLYCFMSLVECSYYGNSLQCWFHRGKIWLEVWILLQVIRNLAQILYDGIFLTGVINIYK